MSLVAMLLVFCATAHPSTLHMRENEQLRNQCIQRVFTCIEKQPSTTTQEFEFSVTKCVAGGK